MVSPNAFPIINSVGARKLRDDIRLLLIISKTHTGCKQRRKLAQTVEKPKLRNPTPHDAKNKNTSKASRTLLHVKSVVNKPVGTGSDTKRGTMMSRHLH